MRTSLLVSLIVAFCVLIGVGPAAASDVTYPDGSSSQAINLGGGANAFVFFDNATGGDQDIFIHPVDSFANLFPVTLTGIFGYALWLDWEGFNGPYMQFGVYACNTQTLLSCSGFGGRRGTLFL